MSTLLVAAGCDAPPCEAPCGSAPPPSGTAGAAPGGTSSQLGDTCLDDADCPSDMVCLREEGEALFGGGPPGGYCAPDCSNDETVCEAFEQTRCVDTGAPGGAAQAYCLPACRVGDSDADKCGGRERVACTPLESSDDGYCRPYCTHDDECASGACDPRAGACVESPSTFDSFGSQCSSTDPSSCEGVCAVLDEGVGVCSQLCTYGTSSNCGDGALGGMCAFPTPGGTFGDAGYCAPLCNCTADCDTEFACDAFLTEEVRSLFGANGTCAPRELVTTPIDSCN